jgi:predicted phage terminase large subunit-like protein
MDYNPAGLYRPKKKKPLTKNQFEAALSEIRLAIQSEVKPFRDTSDAAKEKRRKKGKKDFEWFKRTYLPHYFNKKSGKIHKRLHEICSTGNKSINAVAIAREHGKSVICSFAEYIYKAAYLFSRYSILLSDTFELASEFIAFIAFEFEENERLKCDFGRGGVLETPGWWKEGDIVITTYQGMARIRGMGYKQKIRGTRFFMWRPKYICLDDFENDENVRNKKLVKIKFYWILGAAYPAMDDDGTLVMVGTMLDLVCVLSMLIEHINEHKEEIEKKFKVKAMNAVKFPAILEDGTPLWPEGKSIEKLMQIKATLPESVWLCEYMMTPPDAGKYKLDWMKPYNRSYIMLLPRQWAYFSGSDPSARSGEENDYKAHVVIAKPADAKERYVADVWCSKATIHEMNEVFIDLYMEYDMVACAFEINGYQSHIQEDLQELCDAKGIFPNFKLITHSTDKILRIGRYEWMVQRGLVFFAKNHSHQEILITQLNSLGTKENDDAADAWEMAMTESMSYGGNFEYESAGKRASTEMMSSIVNIGNRRFSASVKFDLFGM